MTRDAQERVAAFVADLRRAPVHRQVEAVVVCGSAARGEEAPAAAAASDIDVMVVTRTRSPLAGRAIARVVGAHGGGGIEGGQVPRGTLRTHRTLLNYEARCNGAVVDGDAAVLRDVPLRGPGDIPAWEAARLLLNRLFEHVKVDAGAGDAAACVAKTYEAIGEAQLVLEGRYRPSFRERWEEVAAAPLPDVVPGLQEKYLQTARRRRTGEPVAVALDVARDDLVTAIGRALAAVTGSDVGPREQLALLAARERHAAHRLYWASLAARHGRISRRDVATDPAIAVWQDGLDHVLGASPPGEAAALLARWRRCPQIVRTEARG